MIMYRSTDLFININLPKDLQTYLQITGSIISASLSINMSVSTIGVDLSSR